MLWLRDRYDLNSARKNRRTNLMLSVEESPKISVIIATYNRSQVLVERTLLSVFQQTYKNIEVVIVGDHCTDDTEACLASLNDPRIVFLNLSARGSYPTDPAKRRLVAGIDPINKCHELATGKWLAHLDDDDIWEKDHLESLIAKANVGNFEFVSSTLLRETTEGNWVKISSGHSTFLYSPTLRSFRYIRSSWRLGLGGDAAMLRRLKMAGVRMGVVDRVTAYVPLRPSTTRFDHLAEDRT